MIMGVRVTANKAKDTLVTASSVQQNMAVARITCVLRGYPSTRAHRPNPSVTAVTTKLTTPNGMHAGHGVHR